MSSNPLLADRMRQDPRVAQARQLLLDAMADHQRQLTGPRPAEPGRTADYQQMIEALTQIRGGSLYYPYLGSGFGAGPLVELADGSVKYDLIGGIGVHHMGHGHPDLLAAGFDAAMVDTVMQGNLQQHTQTLDLSRQFVALACQQGANLPHCFLTSSGAMANENALKLAFHRKPRADRVLAFARNFAGRTLATAQVSDKPAYRQGLPRTLAVDYVPFFDANDPAGSTHRAVAVVEAHLTRYPGQHAAMVLELIQGEGGYHPGNTAFFQAIIHRLKHHDVAVIVDEIQTFGRSSQPFAFQHYQLDQQVDIVTVGKMTQVCCTLFAPAFVPGPGLISQTFTASSAAMQAAQVVLQHVSQGDWFGPRGRNMQTHARFVQCFEQIAKRYPGSIHGPFGLGAMIAFTPFDGSAAVANRLAQRLYQHGLIGFVAGADPTRIRFLPPVGVLCSRHLDTICHMLEQAVAELAGPNGEHAA